MEHAGSNVLWTRGVIGAALCCLLLLLCAAPGGAQSEIAVYQRARSDYFWLMKHPQAKGVYHNWQTLADRFARIYTSNPQGPQAAASLFWMGRIHAGAWHQFKRKADLNEAVDVYRRLIRHFPRSRLSDDAQFIIGSLLEEAGDAKQAYLEYLRVTVNYPKGDQVAVAKRRLDALERKLVGHPQPLPPQAKAPSAEDESASLATVTDLRHWSTPNYTRVVLSLERPVPYNTVLLKKNSDANKPRRLYLDLRGAHLSKRVKETVPIGDGLLQRARAGQFNKDTVRVVLDIKHLASYKVFTLDNPFRVVVDCFGQTKKAMLAAKKARRERKVSRGRAKELPPKLGLAAALGLGIKTIVLDPGHGGKDPGASWRGVKEKDLVLDIAKRLKPLLEKKLGCKVLLTRNRDVFLPLEDRTALANTHDADLFISLHLNAAPSHRLSGVETYFLNLASDDESMRVAARENATTERSISDLQVILNDLMLNSKINESNRLARSLQKGLLKEMRTSWRVRDLKVKQAPFYVLIGARMPAVLVELGFITNPTEHQRLTKSTYRERLAEGIADGVAAYAKQLKGQG